MRPYQLLPPVLLLLSRLAASFSADTRGFRRIGHHDTPVFPSNTDYLIATLCYCAAPQPLRDRVIDQGHWYDFSYYNTHYNTTYSITETCQANHAETETEICITLDPRDHVAFTDTGWEGREICHFYDIGDEMCIEFNNRDGGMDRIHFNAQTRKLDKGQGGEYWPKEQADGICQRLCMEKTGLPLLREGKGARSYKAWWIKMDDMCYGCR